MRCTKAAVPGRASHHDSYCQCSPRRSWASTPSQSMRLTKTAQGETSPCFTFPHVTEAQWGAESPYPPCSAKQGWSTLLFPTPLVSAVLRGKQSPNSEFTRPTEVVGCRASWHSTPSIPTLMVAGSAGNWHYNPKPQDGKVNIQPTICNKAVGVSILLLLQGSWSMVWRGT